MRICYRSPATLLCALASGLLPAPVCAEPDAAPTAALSEGALAATQGSAQREAAVAGLAALAEQLPTSAPPARTNRIFNVEDYRTLRDAAIGDGFEMYLVDPQAVLAGKPVDQSLHGSGIWRFVVLANGKGVGLITVARRDGRWMMVEAGASELADEVMTVAARYARLAPRPQLRFVRCQQAVADLIEVSAPPSAVRTSAPFFVPLVSARIAIAEPRPGPGPIVPSSVLSDAELADALRHRLQRGLVDPRFGH